MLKTKHKLQKQAARARKLKRAHNIQKNNIPRIRVEIERTLLKPVIDKNTGKQLMREGVGQFYKVGTRKIIGSFPPMQPKKVEKKPKEKKDAKKSK